MGSLAVMTNMIQLQVQIVRLIFLHQLYVCWGDPDGTTIHSGTVLLDVQLRERLCSSTT